MSCENQKEGEQVKTEETSIAVPPAATETPAAAAAAAPCEGTERVEAAPAVPAAVCSTPEEAAANAHLKLIITNLGFKCDVSRLERMLKEANIEYVRAKKVFGAVCGSVWFASEAQKEEAKRRLPEVLSPYSKVAGDKIQVLECESVNRHRLERIHRQAKRARTSGDGPAGGPGGPPDDTGDVSAPASVPSDSDGSTTDESPPHTLFPTMT